MARQYVVDGLLIQESGTRQYVIDGRLIQETTSVGSVTGTVAYANANDTLAASGTTTVTGSLAKTNANDTSAASGTSTIVGTSATTNANDTSSASGSTTVTGTLAKTNANDTVNASGSVGSSVTGSLAYTNVNDTVSASGTTAVTGSVAGTNQNDTLAASGTTTVKGSSATTNANDAASASGIVGSVTGTLAYANANDSIAASGSAGNAASKAGGDDYPLRVVHKARKKTLAEQPNKHLESIIAKAVKEVLGEPEEALPKQTSVAAKLDSKPVQFHGIKPGSVVKDYLTVQGESRKALEQDAEKVGELLALYQRQVLAAQIQEDEDLLVLIMEMY